jgi:hypothetical protein
MNFGAADCSRIAHTAKDDATKGTKKNVFRLIVFNLKRL